MNSSDLNNRIKEMVVAFSRNDNIPYYPEAAINRVKQLMREVLDEITPDREMPTTKTMIDNYERGAGQIEGRVQAIDEIEGKIRDLEIDLTVASGQKL